MDRRRKLLMFGGGTVVALIAVGVVLWLAFFRDDAPDEVNLADAVASVEEAGDGAASDSGGADAEPSATTAAPAAAPAADGVEGTWAVDTSIGTFDFESASGSFAGFRVDEELTIGAVTAVGRTGEVAGTLDIAGTTATAATVNVDLSTITTNDGRRDGAARRAMGTAEFPIATFALTGPVDFGAGAADGEPVSVTASGELTIRGVTQPVEVAIEAQLVDGVIALVGSIPVVFADFGIDAPSAPIVVSVDDNGIVEFQLLFTRT